jgi:hypothetical protein
MALALPSSRHLFQHQGEDNNNEEDLCTHECEEAFFNCLRKHCSVSGRNYPYSQCQEEIGNASTPLGLACVTNKCKNTAAMENSRQDPCNDCRPINDFTSLGVCRPYLGNETFYYKASNPQKLVNINVAFDMLKPSLSKDCASNFLALACRSGYRECREARNSTLDSVLAPSLMVCEAEIMIPRNNLLSAAYAVPFGM